MGIVPMCGMISSCKASINIHERNKRENKKALGDNCKYIYQKNK